MEQELKAKIVENNKEISRLLSENETLFKRMGYAPPNDNYAVKSYQRVHVPNGYIRTSAVFWDKYHLDKIVKKRDVKNNISYGLQLSDFYNYLLNRVYIWGSVETMLYKSDIINIVSIIEALILEGACNIRSHCTNCQHMKNCRNHISKNEKNNLKLALKKLSSIGALDFSEDKINEICELIDLRNRVHIRLADKNEFLESKFNLDLHNKAILLLREIAEELNRQVVPYYNRCIGYIEK